MSQAEIDLDDQERERLSQRADLVRSRLLTEIDTLEERRRALVGSVTALGRSSRVLLPVAAGVAVVGIGAAVLAVRRHRRKAHHLEWLNFDRADLRALEASHGKSPWRRVLEKAAGAVLLAVGRRVAERALTRLTDTPVTTIKGPPRPTPAL